MKKEEIEPGVRRMKAPKDPRGFKHGDVFLYNLNEMSEESIAKYGLTRYKARLTNAEV